MDETDFEGTFVLEQLTEIGVEEEFFDAIDSENVGRIVVLLKLAKVDPRAIALIVDRMEASEVRH